MDNYTEQIVTAKPGFNQYLMLFASVTLAAIGVFFVLFINFSTGILILVVGGFAVYFAKTNLSFEYEYIFTNADFEVAKIIAKSKRKNVCEVSDGDIKRILPYYSEKFQNELDVNADLEVKDFSSGEEVGKSDCYVFIKNEKGKDVAVILEFNDKNKEYIKTVYKNKIEK